MKKITLVVLLLLSLTVVAQQGINYKALLKDANNTVLSTTTVTVQLIILKGFSLEVATNVYQETHMTTTDANGIIVITIGDGAVNSGVFDNINWGSDDHFLNTQINTGVGLVDMGTSAFNAVPYALSAKTVENITEIDPKVASILTNTVPKWNGTALVDGLITDDGAKVSIVADASINNITVGKGGSNVSHNTAIGFQSLQSNTTGDANTAIGYQSLFMNIDGIRNTANGEWALFSNESGNQNTASGFHSMSSNLSGFNNSAHGNFSLRANSSGHSNVAMGYRALEFNFSGTFNTAIGNRAGLNSLGTGNVFLGNEAGFSETGSDKLYIDNSNTSDPLLYGDFATNELQVNGSLNINGAYDLPTADGTVNYVMSTDGAGNASWIDPTTFTSAAPTGVEAIDEGNGNGLVKVGRVDDNYGDVGSNAVDLSTSTNLSLTKGATGQYSAAMGVDTEASGFTSTAIGQGTIASGGRSTAMGLDTEASGETSLAMGFGSTSAGQTSIAMGYFTNSLGQYSTTLGISTVARAYNVLAIGRFNVGGGTTDGWVETDPLFEIGNGSGAAAADRSNALTILKNGTITAPSLDISEITDAKTLVTKEFADANYIDAGFSGDYNDLSNLPVLFTAADETDPKVVVATINSVPVWDGMSLVDGSITDDNGDIGINTTAPSQALDIDGQIRMRTGATDGFVPMSSADGTMIWTDPSTFTSAAPTGLEAINEGNGNGLVKVGRVATNYGNVGHSAVDLSFSNGVITTLGATGFASAAMGANTSASGYAALATGFESTASGSYASASGLQTTASGFAAIATGFESTASGSYATAMGLNSTAESYGQTTLGTYNVPTTPNSTTDFNALDRLLVVGNGTALGSESDALVILKNGNMGIGNAAPTAKLDVAGTIKIVDGSQGVGKVLTSGADGLASWEDASITETDPSVPDGTTAGDMQFWTGSSWEVVVATPNEGAALQMIGGIPTWVGGTPPPPPLTVPDAPIIGTASPGNGVAFVPFTAPSNDGGSPIIQYTATSSPGGFTGTLSQAGNGTIVVSGLSNGTAYTFSVTASNPIGTSTSSATSNSVTTQEPGAAAIGDLREGGIVFWVDPTDNTKGKVCALTDAPTLLTWDNAISYSNGYMNPDTGTGVYSNWYLPSKVELQDMYANLQRFGCGTNTPGGIDASLCGTRIGSFASYHYWSSSQTTGFLIVAPYFFNGTQSDLFRFNAYFVRAVRAF
jgi:hypothetical protein